MPPAPRHHQTIVTLFGLFGRDDEHAVRVAHLVRLLRDLGIDEQGARSAISRLKRRGTLESVRIDGSAGYRLVPALAEIFAEGDKRIFSPARAQPDDDWLLVSFSVPEAQRHLRHRIRTCLTRLGFGVVTPGLWIAPGHAQDWAVDALRRDEVADFVDLFRERPALRGDLATSIAEWWDLDQLEVVYRDFLARHPETGGEEHLGDQESFVRYIPTLTDWRRLPYLDPGLPLALLPPGWPADAAQQRFLALHDRLHDPAVRYADTVLGRLPVG